MKFPIPYSRHTITDADVRAVTDTLESGWLTTGPLVAKFENVLASYTNAKYAVVYSSGTAALHAAYHAAGLQPGDEVITTPISFAATANAALYAGATVRFADVTPDTINISPHHIRAAVTSKTKIIAPVDFAGHPVDMDDIMSIAEHIDAIVVEDACHALGATYKQRPVGSLAHMTVFSFHPSKTIAAGEGGAVVTDNELFYERLQLFRQHGITKNPALLRNNEGPWCSDMLTLGYNYRLSDIHCALGISQMNRIDSLLQARKKRAQRYNEAFRSSSLQLPAYRPYVRPSWHIYPIQLPHAAMRRQFVETLHQANIHVQVHYKPIYRHTYYRQHGYGSVYCPRAERFYERCVSLPLYPTLTESEQQYVIDTVYATLRSLL